MGTNYFVELNKCDCCNRSNKIHIGKSSFGWSFTFRGYDGQYGYITDSNENDVEVPTDLQLKSWKQWKEYLKDKLIVDEYGDSQDYEEFVAYIEGFRSPGCILENGKVNKDHITEILGSERYSNIWHHYKDSDEHWHDEDGYSFSKRYFS